MYDTVLWDLDHTLLDSDASEAGALAEVLATAGIDDVDHAGARYRSINRALWHGVEQGTVSPNQVKTLRFEQLVADLGHDADPHVMAAQFADGLGRHGELYAGAHETLELVRSNSSRMAIITNGIGAIQRARIDRLGIGVYFDAIIISGEVGTSKPGREIFELTFGTLGIGPSGAVMVGDSLSSDIAGGANFGIDTIWFDRHHSGLPNQESRSAAGPAATPTHRATSLSHIAALWTR